MECIQPSSHPQPSRVYLEGHATSHLSWPSLVDYAAVDNVSTESVCLCLSVDSRSTVYPADKQSKKDSAAVSDGGLPDWVVFDGRTGLTTDKGIELLVIDDTKSQVRQA